MLPPNTQPTSSTMPAGYREALRGNAGLGRDQGKSRARDTVISIAIKATFGRINTTDNTHTPGPLCYIHASSAALMVYLHCTSFVCA